MDIPSYPNNTYKKEFEGYGVFLGTGTVAPSARKYRSFVQSKKYACSLNIKSQSEWWKHTKLSNFPKDIPVSVSRHYKEKGWKGWPDFLGKKK